MGLLEYLIAVYLARALGFALENSVWQINSFSFVLSQFL